MRHIGTVISSVDSLGIQGLHCLTQRSDESLTDESLTDDNLVSTRLLKGTKKGE